MQNSTRERQTRLQYTRHKDHHQVLAASDIGFPSVSQIDCGVEIISGCNIFRKFCLQSFHSTAILYPQR